MALEREACRLWWGDERRIDITDGGAYTYAEFYEYYRSDAQWDMAQPSEWRWSAENDARPFPSLLLDRRKRWEREDREWESGYTTAFDCFDDDVDY